MAIKDGKVLATFPERPRLVAKRATPGEMCAHQLALDAKSDLYVASDCTPEGISVDIASPYAMVKLDPKGRALAHWTDHVGRTSTLAADGDGTVYATGTFDVGVSIFDAQGRFLNKWGQQGSDRGDLPSGIDGLAVDGHGHVLVLDGAEVRVFDAGGKYRGSFGKGGRALAVGARGDVYVLSDAIDRYALALPAAQ